MPRKRGRRTDVATGTDDRPPDGVATPEEDRLRRQCDLVAAGVAVAMLVIVCWLSTTHVTWPGDEFTDMNTLMSGENFARHGFVRLKLLPVFHLGPMTDPPSYYTHYPPLTNIVNGLLRVVGVESLAVMRVFCGLLCIAGLVCMYRAFAPDIGALGSVCGLGFIATTGYYLSYCISLHHTFNFLFMGVFFLLFASAVRREGRAVGLWAGCWCVLLLESLTSFEFILYPQVFAWVYVFATGRLGQRWRELILLGTAPAVGVGLHFLQNCWALGLPAAAADAAAAFGSAGGQSSHARWTYLSEVPRTLLSTGRLFYFWSRLAFLVFPFAVWFWLADRGRRRSTTPQRLHTLVPATLCGALAWFTTMPSHTVHHAHTLGQLLPLVLIVMGSAIATVVRCAVRHQAPLYHRMPAAACAVLIVYAQLKTVNACFEMTSKQQPPTDCRLFEALGENGLPPKTAALTNSPMEAQLAYFIRRPLWRSPSSSLPFNAKRLALLQSRLPDDWQLRYYIFTPAGEHTVFEPLAGSCLGYAVCMPERRKRGYLIIFDIAPLLEPPGKRRPLDPRKRAVQLKGGFPPWESPGVVDRLRQMLPGPNKAPRQRPR